MNKSVEGIAMVEVLVAIGLFAIIASAVVGMMFAGISSTKQGSDYVVAAGLMQEGVQAVRSIRNRDFAELTDGTHGLDTSPGYFTLNGTSDSLIDGNYTRTITIEDVFRDGNGDISASGSEDVNTRQVTVNVTWDTLEGKTHNIDSVFYVYDFTVNQSTWVQTSLADFSAGYFNSTNAQSGSGDGEVVFEYEDAGWGSLIQSYSVSTDGDGNPVYQYVDVDQNTLYTLSTNTAGDELIRYDISDVSQSVPVKVDGYDVGGVSTFDLEVLNGYVYIATQDNNAEVHVVRASDMVQVAVIDISGTSDAYSLALAGTTLLVGMNSSGAQDEIYAFDVSDPEGVISLIDSVEIGVDCRSLVSDGVFAYCGSDDASQELTVVRLSDYSVVNTLNMTGAGSVVRFRLSGSSLYVGRLNSGIDADFLEIDVSSPAISLPVVNSLDTNSDVDGVFVDIDQEYAFLATNDNTQELTIVDLSTFTEVQWFDVSTGNDAEAVVQFGRFIYLLTTQNDGELNVIRTQSGDWEGGTLLGSANVSASNAFSVVVDGSFAYVGTESNGGDEFYIYDVSTPTSPVFLGSEDIGDDVWDIAVSGNTVYLATANNNSELQIVDVSVKTSPNMIGSYNMSGGADAESVAVNGSNLYVGRSDSGGSNHEFFVFNVSNPSSPTLLTSINYSDDLNDIARNGNILYIATDNDSAELLVIDVSNSSSPNLLSSFNVSGAQDGNAVQITGNTVALGRDSGGADELVLIDVSNPASPVELGGGNVSSPVNALAMDGASSIFIGHNSTNIEFERWDISNMSAPVQVLTFPVGNDVRGMYFDGTNVHLATEDFANEYKIVGSTFITEEVPRRGFFTSEAFDSSSASTSWGQLNWVNDLGATGLFKMEVGSTTANGTFSTVVLTNTYTNPIIIPLYFESANTLPVAVRLNNVTSTSFDVRLQHPGGVTSLSNDTVYYMVVEEGVWTMPDGTMIEAHSIDTSAIGYKNSWNAGVNQAYSHSYSAAPVIFHQVQSYNDSAWIESYVSAPSSVTNPPNTSGFDLALNGAEAVTTHASETIGWVAIEQGIGSINGVAFEVDQTSDTVTGHDNGCSTFSFAGSYTSNPVVIIDQQEMDGADGSWGIACALSSSQIGMHAEEDQQLDSERAHTTETYAFAAFSSAFAYSDASSSAIAFRIRTASSEAGLETAVWVGSDGLEGSLYSASGGTITTDPGATGTRWFQYQAYFVSDGVVNPALQSVNVTYSP